MHLLESQFVFRSRGAALIAQHVPHERVSSLQWNSGFVARYYVSNQSSEATKFKLLEVLVYLVVKLNDDSVGDLPVPFNQEINLFRVRTKGVNVINRS